MEDLIKILIIEDNTQFTESLKNLIQVTESMECVANYFSAEEYLDCSLNKTFDTDVVILDLHLPYKSGLQLIPIILSKMPNASILVLTQNNDYHTTLEAIRLGASGYLLKDSSIVSIRRTIKEIHKGGAVIDPQLSRIVLQALSGNPNLEEKYLLTNREIQVLKLISMGYVKKEVAALMGISYRTVAQYSEIIYKKLQVPNVAAAVASAIRKGLI